MCRECGKHIAKEAAGHKFSHGSYFEKCVFALRYKGVVRKSVLRYKFYNHPHYASVCGKILAGCAEHHLKGRYDEITWVPISRRRLRKRGYDQDRLLAENLAKELGMTARPLLHKIKETKVQSKIRDAARRRANVVGAYRAEPSVRGKRILLVDDIVTTGATLSECARTLLMAGAEEVVCIAFAGGSIR